MVKGVILDKMGYFRYLDSMLTASDYDCPVVLVKPYVIYKDLVKYLKGLNKGGRINIDVRKMLQSFNSVGVTIWVRDVSRDGKYTGFVRAD